MARISFRNLRKPTPKNFRRWGNALFAACQAAAGLTAMTYENNGLAIALSVMGFVGKFISELFGPDEPSSTN